MTTTETFQLDEEIVGHGNSRSDVDTETPENAAQNEPRSFVRGYKA